MIQSGGFLGRLLGPLLKTGLPLMKNVIKSLAKSVLNSFRINCSSINSRWRNTWKNIRFWKFDNINNIKCWNRTIEVKEQKGRFLSTLLGTLGASLGNLLTGKEIYRAGKGKGINRAGEGIVRAGYGNNKMDF